MLGQAASIRAALALVSGLALVVAACGGDDGTDEPAEGGTGTETTEVAAEPHYGGHVSEQYADGSNWICKPGIDDDVCARDLDATAVHADGSTEVLPHEPAEDPPIDCFYVYPTVSFDETPNSDLDLAEAEEIHTTVNQAARLTASCRVFAPAYRQLTLGMIGGGDQEVPEGANPWEVAYGDVVDAFRHYIDNDNQGRGFVLVGHSQGAGHLRQLVMDEIDDEPALRDQLVSAILLGSSVAVPEGEVLGGDFDNVPACEAADQTGCVVSYASFRADEPPPDNSFFGRPREGDGMSLCVNPADPGAEGAAFLQPYVQIDRPEGSLIGEAAEPFADPDRTGEITTPFVTFPEFVEGECVQEGEFSYLALTVHGDPDDPRTDDIGGDLSPEWGMHLIDANVAMGDLVDLVAEQSSSYTG